MAEKGGVHSNFGEFFSHKRRELGLSLREFSKINGLDPGNISKMERGLLSPPQSREKKAQYAAALGIKEGSDDWLEFCDLASVSAGKIPSDIANDAEVMTALPVLFRSIRDKKLDREDIERLVKSIRRELR